MIFQTVLRQIIVGAFGLLPFALGYWFIPQPLNILVICIFSVRRNLPGTTELHEMAILLRFISTSMSLNDRDAEELANIRKAFATGDESVHPDEIKAGVAKIAADLFMDFVGLVLFLLMLGDTVLTLLLIHNQAS